MVLIWASHLTVTKVSKTLHQCPYATSGLIIKNKNKAVTSMIQRIKWKLRIHRAQTGRADTYLTSVISCGEKERAEEKNNQQPPHTEGVGQTLISRTEP